MKKGLIRGLTVIQIHSLSLSLSSWWNRGCHGLSLCETASPLRSLTIYARLILVEIHTHMYTSARTLSIPRISRGEEVADLSRRDFEKSLSKIEIPSPKRFSVHFPRRTELLSDGPRVTRNESSLCDSCLVNKKASARSKIRENCVVTKGGGAALFFFFSVSKGEVGSTSSGKMLLLSFTIYFISFL